MATVEDNACGYLVVTERSDFTPSGNEFSGMTPEELEAKAEQCLIAAFGKPDSSDERLRLERVLTACGALKAEIHDRARSKAVAAVREQLRRILQSSHFLPKSGPRKVPKKGVAVTGFGLILSFVVEETLKGRSGRIKQYEIAEALGKKRAADEDNNPLVRVQVGTVRKKLKSYYEGPGRADPIEITIARGQYTPSFSVRVSLDANEGTPTRLHVVILTGNLGTEVFAALSPDGSQIAFSWNGENEHNYSLYTKEIASNGLRRLTSATADDISPAWSPDGRSIAFLRVSPDRGQILIVSAGTGEERHILDVYPVRWEILGRQLTWHPNGQSLAIVDRRSPQHPFCISLHSLQDGSHKILTSPPRGTVGDSDPAFSATGAQLAFIRTSSVGVKDIYVLAFPSYQPMRVTTDAAYVSGLAWSANSEEIVFSSTRTGLPCLWRTHVYAPQPALISGLSGDAVYPSVRGRRLAYTQLSMNTDIWRLDLRQRSGSGPVSLIRSMRHDVSPHISPDGRKVAFASDRDGGFEIWVCTSDGSAPKRLTSFRSPTGAGSPRWSPDGSHIVFDCRAEGKADLYLVSGEGGKSEPITSGEGENVVPSWSKTNWIYFASNRTGEWQIWRMRPGDRVPVQVTKHGGFAPFESPAGDFVYYMKGRTEAGVWRVPAAGGREKSIIEAPPRGFWGYWAVGRKGVYFLDFERENVSLLNVISSVSLKRFNWSDETVTCVRRIDGLRTTPYPGIAVSPDDAWLLFTQLERSSGNIILKEHFD